MSLLIFFVLLSIGVSFVCSMLEAIILSVTPSYLESLAKSRPKLYEQVKSLKDDIEKPLASILSFNTIAHTIGAAGAGAEAQRIFGSEVLAIFSAILTFAILFFSEIIPKSIGASSWKRLLPLSVKILKPMLFLSYPLVWLSEKISSLFKSGPHVVSREEIAAMTDLGLNDGALKTTEHKVLKSVIKFEKIKAIDVMTPKTKVKSIRENDSIKDAYQLIQKHAFSRIIVLDQNDMAVGYTLRVYLQASYIDKDKKYIREITKPILKLPESVALTVLFQKLLQRREHICVIEGAKGGFLGLITLEDLMEHMLGLDIYDEQDHLNEI